MSTESRRSKVRILPAAVLLVTLSAPALVGVAAGSAPNPGQPSEMWAYGAMHWRNASANVSTGQYQLNAFFGWTVVFTLTNTSNTTFQVEAQRTMAIRYDALLCQPSCASPTARLSVSIHGSDRETGFANFTTAGSVTEAGNATPALGLVDSHVVGQAYLNESLNGIRSTAGHRQSFSTALTVAASARASVTFPNPLGLVPWDVAPGAHWTSSAAFSASGGYSATYAWSISGNNGTGNVSLSGSGNPSGQVNGSGTVALAGTDLGNVTLANGAVVPVIVLVWTSGPFDGLDGIILVPHDFEIFGGTGHPWDRHAQGLQSVATSRVDAGLDRLHHRVHVDAAASTYAGSDGLSSSAGAAVAVRPAATGNSSSLVQAQPESVPQAQATASCLANACARNSGAASPNSLLPILALGLVVVAVVGAVGAIEFRRLARRRAERRMAQVPPPPGTYLVGGPLPPPPFAMYPPAPPAPTQPASPISGPGSPPPPPIV